MKAEQLKCGVRVVINYPYRFSKADCEKCNIPASYAGMELNGKGGMVTGPVREDPNRKACFWVAHIDGMDGYCISFHPMWLELANAPTQTPAPVRKTGPGGKFAVGDRVRVTWTNPMSNSDLILDDLPEKYFGVVLGGLIGTVTDWHGEFYNVEGLERMDGYKVSFMVNMLEACPLNLNVDLDTPQPPKTLFGDNSAPKEPKENSMTHKVAMIIPARPATVQTAEAPERIVFSDEIVVAAGQVAAVVIATRNQSKAVDAVKPDDLSRAQFMVNPMQANLS